jgi:hypothetical protein
VLPTHAAKATPCRLSRSLVWKSSVHVLGWYVLACSAKYLSSNGQHWYSYTNYVTCNTYLVGYLASHYVYNFMRSSHVVNDVMLDPTNNRNAPSSLPDQGQRMSTSTRSTSTNTRFSIASTEMGESSKRNSLSLENVDANVPDQDLVLQPTGLSASAQAGRGSHRSHRSRNSGGFLLSNTAFESPPRNAKVPSTLPGVRRQRETTRDHKGKVVVRASEKISVEKGPSNNGLGIRGSPLATNVVTAGHGQVDSPSVTGGDSTHDVENASDEAHPPIPTQANGLDVDSAQIVNLALNLSESRKIVARRNVSTPLPPTIASFGEGAPGGSLRQYLQQQRRSSRNISPKPDRGDRAFTASPRIGQGQRLESPLQAAFGTHQDGEYQYHFSPSTLMRAEKAKKAIELMAQYRQLLEYVPPLKPQSQPRAVTKSPPSTATGSPTNTAFPLSRTTSTAVSPRPLGRPYNPLQYIRNRKVRARERKAIDGELQGFGDVEKVTQWIDLVSKVSSSEGYRNSDCVALPAYSSIVDPAKSPHTSPQSAVGRNQTGTVKFKRPRVDWMTNPADMIADVFWLEQNDNKKLIEDNRERKLFPQNLEFMRPISRKQTPEPNSAAVVEPKEISKGSLRVDTELPKFKSVRSNTAENHLDRVRGRALHKLQGVTHLPEGSIRHRHELGLSKSYRSSSESSDSDTASRLRHGRSRTSDIHDTSSDLLSKQMIEMLAREEREPDRIGSGDLEGQKIVQSIEQQKSDLKDDMQSLDSKTRRKSNVDSIMTGKEGHLRRESLKPSGESQPSSNRASLDAPGHRGRPSMDGLDSTAPNSPQVGASKGIANFIPSIGIDLSPPPSRSTSPIRKPALSRMRSRINPFQDRGSNHSRSHSLKGDASGLEETSHTARTSLEAPTTPSRRKRSESPPKKLNSHKTDDSMKSTTSKAGSMRRRAEIMPSGIKGLFKGGRNPVSRVGDLLWGKDGPAASVASSNTSTDSSDLEDELESTISRVTTFEKPSNINHNDPTGALSASKETRSYNLPTFTSPFEGRSRNRADTVDTESPESDYVSKRQRAREDRKNSRFHSLMPPRIDILNASPPSSPDLPPIDRRMSRASDISDVFDRRNSYGVQGADARLNSILGLPGALNRLPVTGLAHEDNRRPSIAGKRQWSISDRGVSAPRGPMTKREIARVRALLLSSGIKAKEIKRRASEIQDLRDERKDQKHSVVYVGVAALNRDPQLLKPVPTDHAHVLAAQILSNDIQLSSRLWEESANNFSSQAVGSLLDRIDALQDRILGRGGLSEMTRKAADEADDVSRDLVTGQTLKVKVLVETMQNMMRRRRARFRWVRRGGWVMLEWILVGVMWWAWLVVVLLQIVRGIFGGVFSGVRWLLWL